MTSTTATRRTAPWTAIAAAALSVPLAAVTCFGAFYFSFVYGGAEVTPFGVAFVAAYWGLTATGVAAVAGVLRGRARAWPVAAGYAAAGILFTIAKLVVWHETEAVAFGAASLTLLALLSAPRTRRSLS